MEWVGWVGWKSWMGVDRSIPWKVWISIEGVQDEKVKKMDKADGGG